LAEAVMQRRFSSCGLERVGSVVSWVEAAAARDRRLFVRGCDDTMTVRLWCGEGEPRTKSLANQGGCGGPASVWPRL